MGLLDFDLTDDDVAYLDQMASRITVARALLSARNTLNLTQHEVGEAANSKQARVSEIESLRGNPRLDTLDRIARVVGLQVSLVPRPAARPAEVYINESAEVCSTTAAAAPSLAGMADTRDYVVSHRVSRTIREFDIFTPAAAGAVRYG